MLLSEKIKNVISDRNVTVQIRVKVEYDTLRIILQGDLNLLKLFLILVVSIHIKNNRREKNKSDICPIGICKLSSHNYRVQNLQQIKEVNHRIIEFKGILSLLTPLTFQDILRLVNFAVYHSHSHRV